MAVRFEAAGDRLEIHQTRRALRIATWLFVLFGALGVAMTFIPHSAKVTIACDRAAAECTIGHPHSKDWKQPIAAISSIDLTDDELVIQRRDTEPYHLCYATRTENEAAAQALSKFFAEKQATVATECTTHLPGIPIAGRVAGLFGMALLYFLLVAFLVDAHTLIDRKAGTIAMRGSKWPFKRWKLERKLSEVANVAVRRVYTGRGQSMYLVDVVFSDGQIARAMSPAAYKLDTLQQRIVELRKYVGLAPT